MRYLSALIFLMIMTFLAWPYVHLYQLNSAVTHNDQPAVEKMVDFESVRKIHKENLEWKVSHMVGAQEGNPLANVIHEGAKIFGDATVDTVVDANWLLKRLHEMEGSVWEQTTFAFFESPTRFTIRVGQLGRDPVHVQMTLQDWFWRITAIYD